jgi:hypothetical protein
VFTVDTKSLFIGDGITVGGLSLAGKLSDYNASFISIIPQSGVTERMNASGYCLALQNAAQMRPNGNPLSEMNRYTIFLYPGTYNFTGLGAITNLNNYKYVDTIGFGDRKDINWIHDNHFYIYSGDFTLKNITIDFGPYQTSLVFGDGGGGSSFKNIVLENLTVLSADPGSISPIDIADPLTMISNSAFKNLIVSGGVFSVNFNGPCLQNCLIDNCTFISAGASSMFGSSALSPPKNNVFNNCRFIGGTMFPDQSYGYDSSNLIKNCYFSGTDLLGAEAGEGSNYFSSRMENCIIYGHIYGQGLTMADCYINGMHLAGTSPISLLDGGVGRNYSSFSNCTILAPDSVNAVVNEFHYVSGLFSQCRFNRVLSTGVTGLFGNQGNVVHSSFK